MIYNSNVLFAIPPLMFFAGLGYLLWLPAWMGLNREWVKYRGAGWPPLKGFSIAMFFQGISFGGLAMAFSPQEHGLSTPLGNIFTIIGLIHLIILLPVGLWGMYLPLPKFLLPRWIREYLRVRQENPHYDSLLEIESSRPVVKENIAIQPLLVTVRVQVWRWLISGVFCLGLGVSSLWIFFGLVTGAMEPGGGVTRLIWPLLPIVGVFLILFGSYFMWGALRPEHVTIDESGLRTRSWCLGWSEIKGLESARSKVVVHVTPAAAERIRPVNRWHSGRPGGVGGMLAAGDTVGLQSSLASPYGVISVVESQLSKRGARGF